MCNSSIADASLSLHNYSLETELKDRTDTRKGVGGGLLVYYQNLQILPVDNYNNFNQHCSFKVGKGQNQFSIMLMYRPPGSQKDDDDKLRELFHVAERNLIFIGDFNMPGVNWDRWTAEARWRELMVTAGRKHGTADTIPNTHKS